MAEDDVCPLCLVDIDDGQPTMNTPCGHAFHLACLVWWFRVGNSSCPMCRCALPDIGEAEKQRRRDEDIALFGKRVSSLGDTLMRFRLVMYVRADRERRDGILGRV